MLPRAAAAILVLASLLWVAPAAALMREVPLATLAAGSDAIVSAHVIARQSHWLASPHIIVTDVRLRVDEPWSGSLAAGDELTLEVEGGVADGIRMWTEHQPVFADGEAVVLFLSRSPGWQVKGLEQGRYSIAGNHVRDWLGRSVPLVTFRSRVRSMVPVRDR